MEHWANISQKHFFPPENKLLRNFSGKPDFLLHFLQISALY